MDTVKFNDKEYLSIQTNGNAARFTLSFAQEILSGKGLDIGCSKKEWAFPGATPIDIVFDDPYDAMNLPDEMYNYIFSSHCLEHLNDWVGVLDYWHSKLRVGGILYLYLPHYSQEYWRPWNNRKHINILQPEYLDGYFKVNRKWSQHIVTQGYDLYNAFTAIARKQ